MDSEYIPLNVLPVGRTGRVKELRSFANTRWRMLDLGLIGGTIVEALRRSPSGDPVAYRIRGAVIALRSEEAAQILIEPL